MVATAIADEVHVAVEVRSWEVPSEEVPVAVNCFVRPSDTDGLTGVTSILVSVRTTVRVVEPLIPPDAARIVVLPDPTPVASPLPSMVATFTEEELHVTEDVRFRVLPSE